MNKEWFEMLDIRRRSFNKSVWIPLRAVFHNVHRGEFGYEGYIDDFSGTGSIAVPTKQEEAVKKLGWNEIGIGHEHSGWVDNGFYKTAESYVGYTGETEGKLAASVAKSKVRQAVV